MVCVAWTHSVREWGMVDFGEFVRGTTEQSSNHDIYGGKRLHIVNYSPLLLLKYTLKQHFAIFLKQKKSIKVDFF